MVSKHNSSALFICLFPKTVAYRPVLSAWLRGVKFILHINITFDVIQVSIFRPGHRQVVYKISSFDINPCLDYRQTRRDVGPCFHCGLYQKEAKEKGKSCCFSLFRYFSKH